MKPYPSISIHYRSYGRILLVSAAVALVVLFIAKLLPGPNAFLIGLEESATRAFNAMLGRRSVLDWSVIIASSSEWVVWSLIAGIVSLLIEGWLTRTRHYGRLFGFALFAVFLTIVTEELGDTMSDVIEHRDSPWVVISGLTDLRAMYDDDPIEMPSECGFPDENVMGWTCLAVLLILRAPRTAILVITTLLIYVGAHLAMGTRWLLDMATAFGAGSLIAGAVLVGGERPIRWIERKTEEGFLYAFWRSLATTQGLRGHPRPEGAPESETFRKPRLQHAKRRDRFWHALIRREVLPALNIPASEYRLQADPPFTRGKVKRTSPYVRFLSAPGREIFVVKAAWRFGWVGYRRGRIARYETSARYNVALDRLGLPVPRLYWSRESYTFPGMQRYCILVEEFIDGHPLDTENLDEIRPAMALLAKLHSNERENWGNLLDTRPNARGQFIWHSLRPQIYTMAREMSRWYGKQWPAELTYQIWKFIEAEAETVLSDASVPFRLIHGDVTANNLLVAERGVVMIDFITLKFDLAGPEIVKAVVGLTREDPSLRPAAWRTYFESAGEERWQKFLKQSKLAFLLYAMREISHRRAGGTQKGRKPENPEDILRWLSFAADRAQQWFGATPEETDWDAITAFLDSPVQKSLAQKKESGTPVASVPPQS